MKNDELLHKWIEGTITPDELKIFQQREEYPSLINLHQYTENLTIEKMDQDGMLSEILKQQKLTESLGEGIEKPEAKMKALPRRTWMKYAAAAAVLLLLGLVYLFPSGGEVVHELAQGKTQEGALPDNSTFVLNADSKLTYHSGTWVKDRILDLNGEAYFEVQKGSTFTVNTNNGQVKVLGTHFNVKSRQQYLEVSCQEGRVAVYNDEGVKIQELTPNEAIRLEADGAKEFWKTDNKTKASWTTGLFKFRKVPLEEVLDELQRQFDIQINNKGIATDAIISCNFQNKNLELALKTTLDPLGLQFRKLNEKQIEIYK